MLKPSDITAWRERKFLTHGDAAKRLTHALGRPVDRVTIVRWERGDVAVPDDLDAAKLAIGLPLPKLTKPVRGHSISTGTKR